MKTSGLLKTAAFCLFISLPAFSPAHGEIIANAPFADNAAIMGKIMPLYSGGVLKEAHHVRYVAALYLPKGIKPEQYGDDVHKCLEFYYQGHMGTNDLSTPPLLNLKTNLSPEKFLSLQERLNKITSAYHEVKKGDRCALAYLPGKGTELSCNGKPLAMIEGADFAAAYFGVWLGKTPFDERLQKQLMRKREIGGIKPGH